MRSYSPGITIISKPVRLNGEKMVTNVTKKEENSWKIIDFDKAKSKLKYKRKGG